MTCLDTSIEKQARAFCASVGRDALLVQGPGGNVSWKDGAVLWIKASGTWLADAGCRQIFLPVDLAHLRSAIGRSDFAAAPSVIGPSSLRPSIETMLHALMPHRAVAHLHAVEILAHLVRADARRKMDSLVGDALRWVYVDYFRPGADLAGAVLEQLVRAGDADVVFLANHGVVIGGEDFQEVASILRSLTLRVRTHACVPPAAISPRPADPELGARGYRPCGDPELARLAGNDAMVNRLRREWALYPDHVVFLGAAPAVLDRDFTPSGLDEMARGKPPFIFLAGDGVYESAGVTAAQRAQLRCYHDVIVRQGAHDQLVPLSGHQVAELLDWEAEKYRKDAAADTRGTP